MFSESRTTETSNSQVLNITNKFVYSTCSVTISKNCNYLNLTSVIKHQHYSKHHSSHLPKGVHADEEEPYTTAPSPSSVKFSLKFDTHAFKNLADCVFGSIVHKPTHVYCKYHHTKTSWQNSPKKQRRLSRIVHRSNLKRECTGIFLTRA